MNDDVEHKKLLRLSREPEIEWYHVPLFIFRNFNFILFFCVYVCREEIQTRAQVALLLFS